MSRQTPSWIWPLALVVVAAIFALTAYTIFVGMARAPVQAARLGGEALANIASAFRAGTVETRFRTFTRGVTGSSRLQFSDLDAVESFERTESSTVLWGALALPDVVVEATVPVSYTFYLDLEEVWRLDLTGNRLTVSVPPIRFNPPAPDVSELRVRVVEDSVLRDSEQVVDALRARLTPLLQDRARDNVELVREVGRRRAELFVRDWILQDFPLAEDLRVDVVFEDEEPKQRLAPDSSGSRRGD